MSTLTLPHVEQRPSTDTQVGPPPLFIYATVVLSLLILLMAVAEATLWTHFLIDERNEPISLLALGVVFLYGLYLHSKGRLSSSLLLFVPWLAYPPFTQADQIIDNMTINQMRVVCDLILVVLFLTPIYVLVLGFQAVFRPATGGPPRQRYLTFLLPGLHLIATGREREGRAVLVTSLLLISLWVAHHYLGTIMVLTLLWIGLVYLYYLDWGGSAELPRLTALPRQLSLALLILGCLTSVALFFSFKYRPGAYQGSPHYLHDPSQRSSLYPLDRISVPASADPTLSPEVIGETRDILDRYGASLYTLLNGYFILDRNYNYSFHNALFLRSTPTLPAFREVGLKEIERARQLADNADQRLRQLVGSLPPSGRLAAFVEEVRQYVAFNFRRAALLNELSEEFQRTEAGFQHATHLYEGEGKILGELLMKIIEKHHTLLFQDSFSGAFDSFLSTARQIHGRYKNRIVGF